MRSLLSFTLLVIVFLSYGQKDQRFLLGEKISIDVNYGIFKVGEGHVSIDPEYQYPNGVTPYFLVNFQIQSTGLISFFYSNLQICYEAYISSENFTPYFTKREMIYKGSEVQLDYYTYSDSIYVRTYKLEKNETRDFVFELDSISRKDILGTYLMMRMTDLTTIQNEIKLQFYLENTFNDIYVYPGYDSQSIKGQTATKYRLVLPGIKDLPENKSSYVWISNENRPLKIALGTKFGSVVLMLNN